MSLVNCEEVWRWMGEGKQLYLLHCTKHKIKICERIPGAFDFALEEIYTLQDLIHRLALLGIPNDSNLAVCYQTSGLDAASEAWWLLQALGRTNTAVLSGGLQEWRKLQYATSMQRTEPMTSPLLDLGYQQMPHRYKVQSEIQEMLKASENLVQLIDSEANYRVAVHFDPMAGIKSGGKLENAADMKNILESSGIDLSEETTTIVIGSLASIVLLQLASVGKKNICIGLVDRTQDSPSEVRSSSIEINNEEFYSVLAANDPPSQFLSVVETIYYDALGGGSQRPSLGQVSDHRHGRVESNAHSSTSDLQNLKFSFKPGQSGHVQVIDPERASNKSEKRRKVGNLDRCSDCRMI